MLIEPSMRIFIAGKTQSGKSFLSKKLLQNFNNRLIYDLKREYGDLGIVVSSITQLDQLIKRGCTKIVYQPNDLSIDYFDNVCKYVFQNLKNLMFCIDEIHNYCSKSFISQEFKRIITITQGDPYRIGVMAITQRPQNVHNDIISNASMCIIFKLNLKRDADIMADNTGISTQELIDLPYHYFFVYNDRSQEKLITKFSPI